MIGGTASWTGSEEPGSTITLAGITVGKDDTDDTLSATISGIGAGWTGYENRASVREGGAEAVADVTGGKLTVGAPDGCGDTPALPPTVSSAECSVATSATDLVLHSFPTRRSSDLIGGTASWTGSEEPGSTITLAGITVGKDDTDDTLSATISGIGAGWT